MGKPTVEEVLKELKKNPNFNVFMQTLSESPLYRNLLFLHKMDLFGVEGAFVMPSLPYTGEFSEKMHVPAINTRVIEYLTGVATQGNLSSGWMKILGIESDSEMRNDFFDLVAYLLFMAVRSNRNLVDLINDPDFNYQRMKEKLGNISEFVSGLSEQLGQDETSSEELDPVVKKKAEKVAKRMQNYFEGSWIKIIESISEAFPNLKLLLALMAPSWEQGILENSDLEYEEYSDILDTLYLHKLIDLRSSIFWCDSCGLENPSYTELHGRVAPGKLHRARCLTCGKYYSYVAFYSLSRSLEEALFFKDGLISIYLGWLLEMEEIPFKCNTYEGMYECDFIVGNTLIECKTLRKRTMNDRVAIESELKKSLEQIEKHIGEYPDDEITSAVLVWNLAGDDSSSVEEFLKTHSVRQFQFRIISPEQIGRLVSDFKRVDE
jgi:hypothetical protein